jgi:integrase
MLHPAQGRETSGQEAAVLRRGQVLPPNPLGKYHRRPAQGAPIGPVARQDRRTRCQERGIAGQAPVRSRKGQAWSTEEARQFLESARHDNDPLYAAYVQVLVLGLRKGEVLGLTWDGVNLEKAELITDLQTRR